MLMLEEMTNVEWTGYQTEVTKTMLEDMVTMLAKMHGAFWETKDPVVQELVTYSAGFQGYAQTCHVREAHNKGWLEAKDVIPSALFDGVQDSWEMVHLATDRESLILSAKRLAECCNSKGNAVLPHTLVHSDVHIGR